jgi:hypothetical protein
MKMKFRYLYDRLQEVIIKRLQEETEAKFRIRADRTIEFAKKWYPYVEEKVNEIRFDMFVKPLIRTWNESIHISKITHKLADKNIPFIIENHNGTDWIIYEEHDVDAITDIECDLGLGIVDLLNKN